MNLYRRVLLATDFSDNSAAALVHAARLAQRENAELHALHVRPALRDVVAHGVPDNHATDDVVGDHELRSWIRSCGYESSVGVTRLISAGVSASPHIVRYAEQNGIDLIVVGSHGRGGVATALLGSQARSVVHHAPCDVLVVRQDAPSRAIEHVLAPVDLSAHSRDAMRHAADFALRVDARLTVLMAVEPLSLPPYMPIGIIEKAQRENAVAGLEDFVREAELPLAAKRIAHHGRAHHVIADYARDEDVDLIVISRAGLSGIDRLFTGSVTNRVLRTAPCAVLVHRAVPVS